MREGRTPSPLAVKFPCCKTSDPSIPLQCATGRKSKSLAIILFSLARSHIYKTAKGEREGMFHKRKKQTNKQYLYPGGIACGGERKFSGEFIL